MRRKQLAVDILRTLRLLGERHQQENNLDEGKIYADELKAVEICLNPLLRNLEEKPVYITEVFEDKQWKPVPFVNCCSHTMALQKQVQEKQSNNDDYRIGRYFREMEI